MRGLSARDAAARAALDELLRGVPKEVQDRLVPGVSGLLEREREQERERCANVCRRRAELWRHTKAAESPVTAAREEARARANEALYLADLLVTGQDSSDLTPRSDA